MKVSTQVENLVPYRSGKPIDEVKREYGVDTIHKLASNENPLGLSDRVKQAVVAALEEGHRYPDAGFYDLRKKFSSVYGVSESQLSFGNGSNEVIDLLIRTFAQAGDAIAISEMAFVAYKICALAAQVDVVEIPNKGDFEVDLDALAHRVLSETKIKLVFIPNPNNPTGAYIGAERLKRFLDKLMLRKEDVLVVLDEAYNEFISPEYPDPVDGIRLLQSYPHVALIRTLSKVHGLAGLRFGVLVARERVVNYFDRVRNPFNVNVLAQAAALAAVDDEESISKSCQLVFREREFLCKELKELGVRFWPSQANFILFESPVDVQALNVSLLRQGVIARPVDNYGLRRHLRLSVGLHEENVLAVAALKKSLIQLRE